jgi:cyclopropane-fatty-acyl-phospholipid synthase
MISNRVPGLTPARAASILREIFEGAAGGWAFRLWDGTDVPLGEEPPRFTIVLHAPRTFARLIRNPSPLNFAEMYVDGAIDIEGDLFAAMDVANAIENIKVPLTVRLRAPGAVWAA